MDYRVLNIDVDGNVLVEACDLRRVRLQESGEILGELMEQWDAEILTDTYNELARGEAAEIVTYRNAS